MELFGQRNGQELVSVYTLIVEQIHKLVSL
jgi:hypothetical protein